MKTAYRLSYAFLEKWLSRIDESNNQAFWDELTAEAQSIPDGLNEHETKLYIALMCAGCTYINDLYKQRRNDHE